MRTSGFNPSWFNWTVAHTTTPEREPTPSSIRCAWLDCDRDRAPRQGGRGPARIYCELPDPVTGTPHNANNAARLPRRTRTPGPTRATPALPHPDVIDEDSIDAFAATSSTLNRANDLAGVLGQIVGQLTDYLRTAADPDLAEAQIKLVQANADESVAVAKAELARAESRIGEFKTALTHREREAGEAAAALAAANAELSQAHKDLEGAHADHETTTTELKETAGQLLVAHDAITGLEEQLETTRGEIRERDHTIVTLNDELAATREAAGAARADADRWHTEATAAKNEARSVTELLRSKTLEVETANAKAATMAAQLEERTVALADLREQATHWRKATEKAQAQTESVRTAAETARAQAETVRAELAEETRRTRDLAQQVAMLEERLAAARAAEESKSQRKR